MSVVAICRWADVRSEGEKAAMSGQGTLGKKVGTHSGQGPKPSRRLSVSSPLTFIVFSPDLPTRCSCIQILITVEIPNLNDLFFHSRSLCSVLACAIPSANPLAKSMMELLLSSETRVVLKGTWETLTHVGDCWSVMAGRGWPSYSVSGFPKLTQLHYLMLSAFQQIRVFIRWRNRNLESLRNILTEFRLLLCPKTFKLAKNKTPKQYW